MSIFKEVKTERKKQNEKFGGPDVDDTLCGTDWMDFIASIINKARQSYHDPITYRKHLIRIMVLSMAAIESFDRQSQSKEIQIYNCLSCNGELTYSQIIRNDNCVHCGVQSFGNMTDVSCTTMIVYRNPNKWQFWKRWLTRNELREIQ